MNELIERWNGSAFPEMIRGLPEVDLAVDGIRGWLLQGETSQAAFFDVAGGVEVPPRDATISRAKSRSVLHKPQSGEEEATWP